MQKGLFLHDYTCLAIVAIYCIRTWLDLLCKYTGHRVTKLWHYNLFLLWNFVIYEILNKSNNTFFNSKRFHGWRFSLAPSIQKEYFPNLLINWFLCQICLLIVSNFNLHISKFHKIRVRLDSWVFQKAWEILFSITYRVSHLDLI